MSKSITRVVSSIVLLAIVAAPSFLYAWSGKVVGISDGDTIKVLNDRQEVKIRLHGIDTPETKQAYGIAAKKVTAKLTAGKIVEVEQTDIDKYHRTVAIITVAGVNVNQALVQSGGMPGFIANTVNRHFVEIDCNLKNRRRSPELDFGKTRIRSRLGSGEKPPNSA